MKYQCPKCRIPFTAADYDLEREMATCGICGNEYLFPPLPDPSTTSLVTRQSHATVLRRYQLTPGHDNDGIVLHFPRNQSQKVQLGGAAAMALVVVWMTVSALEFRNLEMMFLPLMCSPMILNVVSTSGARRISFDRRRFLLRRAPLRPQQHPTEAILGFHASSRGPTIKGPLGWTVKIATLDGCSIHLDLTLVKREADALADTLNRTLDELRAPVR